ncbi:MAG: (Fe-S)-binding protein [Bacteroidales bacterium]|nr:(Fe-S)-binding protein [Bacteroidales bacterium]
MEKIDKGIQAIAIIKDSKLFTHLNACVHCGLCAESCLYYRAYKEAKYIPARKVDMVASVYRRYHTFLGKRFPWLTNARKLNEECIDELIDMLYGSCTMCGRCNAHCSIGVDIEYVVRAGRMMLAYMGYVPGSLQSTVDAALNTGNNMAIPTDEFVDTLEWLEEDLQMEVEDDEANIPLDKKNCNILYTLNPREPKFFPLSISAMAKVFYAAGESYTISSQMYDVTNYGYFSSHEEEATVIGQKLHDEMLSLNAGTCVLAECGHGSRAFRWETPNYLEKQFPFKVLTSVELIAQYIRLGKIKTDPSLITERVTLHDPCNLARSGGVINEQRYILENTVSDFVEMMPNGADNFCCGGGGGQMAMGEYNDRRIRIGSIKAEQIKNTGASIVVTPCHNCVDQLMQINATYKLNVQIKTLAEIIADALVFDVKHEEVINKETN